MSKTRLQKFLNSRLGWKTIFEKPIPIHANSFTYMLGGLALTAGIILGVTGTILAQFYHPHPEAPGAYESLQYIINRPDLAFVRNVHYWTAQLMVLLVILHMIRIYVAGSYKKPREILWVTGVILFLLTSALAFTGTILKWDQEAIEALGHSREVAEFIGAAGYWLLPQFAPDVPLLTRVFQAHVSLLPMLVIVVIGLHFVLIRVLGISEPKAASKNGKVVAADERTVPFWTHIKKMSFYGIGLIIAVLLISLVFPAPLGMKAVEGIEVTKPPWFLLPIYGIENFLGLQAIPYFAAALSLALLIVPVLDRDEVTDPRKRRMMIAIMFIVLLSLVALMFFAAIVPPKVHLG